MFNKTLEKLRVDKSGKKLPKKKKKEKTKDKPLQKTVSSKKTKKAKKKPIPKESAKTQINKKKVKKEEKPKTVRETELPLLTEIAKEELDVLEMQELKDQIELIEDDILKMTEKEPSLKFEESALVPLLKHDLPSPSSYEGRNYVKLGLPPQIFKMDIPGTEVSRLKNEFYAKNQKQIKDYLTSITAEELILDLYRLLKQYDISELPTLPTENVEEIVQIIDTVLEKKGAILEVAIDTSDKCWFWYDDKTFSIGTAANAFSTQTPKYFSVPGSQNCENIMGIGISSRNIAYYWYKDETGSNGRADNATYFSKGTYTVKYPDGKQADNVVGIAITRGDAIYYWYDDLTASRGTSRDASQKVFNYSLADNKTPQDLVGIGLASGDKCFYWYKDGTYSIGTVGDAKLHGQGFTYYIPPDKLYMQLSEPTPEPEPEPDATQAAIEEYEKYEEKYNLFRKYVDIAIDNELFPSFHTTMGGDILLNLGQSQVEPQLFFIETLRLTSFPGDYGAGAVIKTFSLLPKEETNISVRTWKKSVTSINESSSILDSYTDEKANEFENSVQTENANASQIEQSNSYHVDAGANVSWTGGSANVNFGCEGSTNSQRQESAKVITNSIEKHSQKASAKREVTVETSYEKIEEAGAEEAITRTIENLNASRTLNFIFRQMNQQFHTLLHLIDIRIGFYNGIPGSMKEYALHELETIVDQYLVNEYEIEIPSEPMVQQVLAGGSTSSGSTQSTSNVETRKSLEELNRIILETYRNVHDYQSVKKTLVETVPTYNEDMEKIHEYIRVIPPKIVDGRKIGQQDYTLREAEDGRPAEIRDVDGIIIGRKIITMRTDGVLVESLLGETNALDQYALDMQREEVRARRIENNRIQVGLGLINALIKDKQYQAAINAYKDIFSIKEGMKAFTEVFDKQKYIVER